MYKNIYINKINNSSTNRYSKVVKVKDSKKVNNEVNNKSFDLVGGKLVMTIQGIIIKVNEDNILKSLLIFWFHICRHLKMLV